jgi:phosphodiesterase/alkaline phosphatase D-like protein
VFVPGDSHSSWANELTTHSTVRSPTAVEFVVTSVTSDNVDDFLKLPPRTASLLAEGAIKALNRHVKFVELDSHGYTVLDVRPDRVQADWWYLADRTSRTSGVKHGASYTVASGSQRVTKVADPV